MYILSPIDTIEEILTFSEREEDKQNIPVTPHEIRDYYRPLHKIISKLFHKLHIPNKNNCYIIVKCTDIFNGCRNTC